MRQDPSMASLILAPWAGGPPGGSGTPRPRACPPAGPPPPRHRRQLRQDPSMASLILAAGAAAPAGDAVRAAPDSEIRADQRLYGILPHHAWHPHGERTAEPA